MKKRPNILMLVSDHQLHYRHGWDGGTGPLRPAFDSFRAQSASFDRAYAVTPLCGPARRTLLTGLSPHNHRNIHNQTEHPYDHELYLDRFGSAGYRNFYFGKWHAGPGSALEHCCDGFCPEFYGNPYITEEYKAYLKKKGLPPAEHRIDHYFWNKNSREQFKGLDEGVDDYRCRGSWCGEPCVGVTVTPEETHESFFLADLACERLEAVAEEKTDRPFHMRVDMWGPHQPYFPTQNYLDLYDPSDINEYGSFRDTLKDKPACYRKMNRPIADESGEMIVPSIFPWEKWQGILAKAYAQSTMTDAALGRIVSKLDALGLGEDTVVLWTSDHGDALASHGGMFDKGSFMTEETVRIPLSIRFPNREFAGKRSGALVNTIDIPPTLMDLAGTAFNGPVDGNSLLPLLRGETQGREEMLLESYGQGYRDTQRSRTLVTKRYKYTVYEDDISELYDLENDPFEMENLRREKGLVKEMDHRLWETLAAAEDSDGLEIFKRKR